MAWIESHDTLRDHPKTRRAARMLGVSIPTIVGHLHLLWHWCLKYAEDGILVDYDHTDIAEAVMWEGDPDKLVDALVHCGPGERAGFLEYGPGGALMVHDWMDYAGRLVAKREEAREAGARGNHERWHVQRGITDPDCPYCVEPDSEGDSPEESQVESGGHRGAIRVANRGESHLTVPNLTVPNRTGQTDRAPAREPVLKQEPLPEPFASMSVGLSVVPSSDDELPEPHDDMVLRDVADRYQHRIGVVGGMVLPTCQEWHTEHGVSYGVIAAAVDLTAEARSDGRIRGSPDRYLFGVIRGLHNDGVRTVADLREKERADPSRRGKRFDPDAFAAQMDRVLEVMDRDEGAGAPRTAATG